MASSPYSPFAMRLRQLREEAGLSQADLAKMVDLKPAMISHLETDQRQPSILTVRALADKLGVSMDYLVGRSEHRSNQPEPVGDTPAARAYRTMAGFTMDKQAMVEQMLKGLKESSGPQADPHGKPK